jgi:Flp pilus assembly protein TadG
LKINDDATLLLNIRSLTKVLSIFSSSRGSASIEFSLLAIPLFIPLFIYMSHFAHVSDGQNSLRTLARESARSFVMSRNDESAFHVAEQVFLNGGEALGYGAEIKDNHLTMKIQCEIRPCISPNAKIEVDLYLAAYGEKEISVGAIEYVSPWA